MIQIDIPFKYVFKNFEGGLNNDKIEHFSGTYKRSFVYHLLKLEYQKIRIYCPLYFWNFIIILHIKESKKC